MVSSAVWSCQQRAAQYLRLSHFCPRRGFSGELPRYNQARDSAAIELERACYALQVTMQKAAQRFLTGLWSFANFRISWRGVSHQGLLKRQTSLGRVFMSLAQSALIINILNTMSLGVQKVRLRLANWREGFLIRPDSGSFLLNVCQPDTVSEQTLFLDHWAPTQKASLARHVWTLCDPQLDGHWGAGVVQGWSLFRKWKHWDQQPAEP